jgi:hypothetical protein
MLLAGAAPQAGGPGAAPTPDASAIQVEKIRERLYLLRGGGRSVVIAGVTVPSAGNTTAFVTARVSSSWTRSSPDGGSRSWRS